MNLINGKIYLCKVLNVTLRQILVNHVRGLGYKEDKGYTTQNRIQRVDIGRYFVMDDHTNSGFGFVGGEFRKTGESLFRGFEYEIVSYEELFALLETAGEFSLFPKLLNSDRQVHVSASNKVNQRFISLQNGILSLNSDKTWEWSERQ